MSSISNLYYKEEEKGKVVKSSKIHYHWGFIVNDVNHTIELIDSRLSTKKQIIINGKVLYKSDGIEHITKTFDLAQHTFVLIPHGKRYELRVDGNPFNHLMMIEDNKKIYNSSKSLQNWQIDEPEETLIQPHRNQSNLEVNRLCAFNIKPKVVDKEVYRGLDSKGIKQNGGNSNRDSIDKDKDKEEINLLDLNLDFNHPQPLYHPYSSNNFNFNFDENMNQYSYHTQTNHYTNSQIPYQLKNNNNPNSLYEINEIQKGRTMIDFFD